MSEESFAQKARREKIAQANAMGVDETLISEMVETFYRHIQTHDLLGPIFASKVENWEPHLARMKDFWTSIAIESGRYHGNPMGKHIAIKGLKVQHFDAWLCLWDRVVDQLVENEEAVNMFKDRAQRIAKSLKIGIGIEDTGFGIIKGIKSDA